MKDTHSMHDSSQRRKTSYNSSKKSAAHRHSSKKSAAHRHSRVQGLEFADFKPQKIGYIDSRELREKNLHFLQDNKLKGSAPVEAISGVGIQTALKMHKQDIFTVKDLEDYTQKQKQMKQNIEKQNVTELKKKYSTVDLRSFAKIYNIKSTNRHNERADLIRKLKNVFASEKEKSATIITNSS